MSAEEERPGSPTNSGDRLGPEPEPDRSGDSGKNTSNETEPDGVDFVAPEPYVEVRFVEVAMVLPSPNPLLILEEFDPPHRRLVIPIGMAEGVAIAHAARRTPTPRPLTHELFAELMTGFGIELLAVRITAVEASSYAAELVLSSPSGSRTVACRPTDAVALALRQRLPVPITVGEGVLGSASLNGSSGV